MDNRSKAMRDGWSCAACRLGTAAEEGLPITASASKTAERKFDGSSFHSFQKGQELTETKTSLCGCVFLQSRANLNPHPKLMLVSLATGVALLCGSKSICLWEVHQI